MGRNRKILYTALTLAAAALPLSAHGGRWPGPGDTVPPGAKGRGPSVPSGPSTPPGPSGPSTPSGPGPAAPSGPATPNRPLPPPPTGRPGPALKGPMTRRGISLSEPDLTRWEFWWERNKAPYLALKRKIWALGARTGRRSLLPGMTLCRFGTETLRPSEETLRSLVVPALKKAMGETGNRDIVTSCLVALAKIGRTKDLGKTFSKYLTDPDQEIAETALLSYGVAGLVKAVPDLVEILKDTPRGRKLLERPQGIPYRRRAYAAYALGLIAKAHKDVNLKRTVFQAARGILEGARSANRDIPVSALLAVRSLHPDLSDPKGLELALEASRFLLDYLKDRRKDFQARAHAPTALSRLLGRSKPGPEVSSDSLAPAPRTEAQALREEVIGLMKGYLKRHKENDMILQSCVLALGEMGDPKDLSLIRLLKETSQGKTSRDLQVRFFSYIALGYLGAAGAEEALEFLALKLQRRGLKRDKPWIALALGVSQAERSRRGASPTPGAGDVLLRAFRETKNESWRGAMAVALGLARFRPAVEPLRKAMLQSRHSEFKGYCAVALGLLEAREAVPDLRRMLERSVNLPGLLRQAAVGLGLMGEKTVVLDLVRVLHVGPRNLAALSAVAMGLGFVGDRRAVPPLVDMLFDRKLTELTRAFAAVALGIVGDKDELPWNAEIGFGLNYRADVETLTGKAAGILDIL